MVDIKINVLSSLKWTAALKVLGQLVAWTVTLIMVRILSPGDYGLFGIATVVTGFLHLVSEMGLGAVLIQKKDLSLFTQRQIFGLIILINASIAILLWLAAPYAADFFNEPELTLIVRVLGAQFVLMAFYTIPQSLLQRDIDFKRRSIVEMWANLASSGLQILLAINGFGVWALVWGNLMTIIGLVIGMNIAKPFLHWPTFDFRGVKALFSFSLMFVASRVLWFVYANADVVIAGRMLGKELLGGYYVAMHFATLPISKITKVTNQISFAAFSRMQDNKEELQGAFLKAMRLQTILAFPLLWGMSSVAPELFKLVVGENFVDAWFLFQLLTLVTPVRMLNSFFPMVYNGMGRPDMEVKNLILACLIMPIAFLVGIRWGIEGLAWAWLLVFPMIFIVNFYRCLPILGIKMRLVMIHMYRPIVCAGMMYLCVALSRPLLTEVNEYIAFAVLVLVGMVSYTLFSWFFNREGLMELKASVKH